MTNKNQNTESAVNLPATFEQQFNAIELIEKTETDQLIELTSDLLKLEAGESFTGILTNQVEYMTSQDGDGSEFPCAVLYAKNKSKVLCADAVVLSTQKRLFSSVEPGAMAYQAVKMECRGMRKSSTNSKNEYRDIKIFTA